MSVVAIIDYGAGNLHSVKNALDYLNIESIITSNPEEILSADKVILPGVGSFGDAMESLNKTGLANVIKEVVKKGTDILGICLGLQLFFEKSEECPGVEGLGIFKGEIVRIPKKDGLKIPHMAWNNIEITKKSRILKDLGENPYVYFVHSYYLKTEEKDLVSAVCEYGENLSIAIEDKNVFGLQFHPEKSGKVGMKILENFILAK